MSELARSSAVVAAGTLLSRLTGLARTVMQAFALGSFALADAYNFANTAPNLLYDLLAGGVLAATIVPVFVDNLERRDERGTGAVLTVVGTMLLLVTALAMAASPLIALPLGDDPEKQRLVTLFLLLLLPQIFFYGLSTLLSGLLNSRRRFAAAAFAPVLSNVVIIGALAWFSRVAGNDPTVAQVLADRGLLVLAGLGTTAGIVVMALALVPAVRHARIKVKWHFDRHDRSVKKVLALSGWTFGYVAVNQAALWTVIVLANRHGQGDLTAYVYAYQFFQLPYGFLAASIITASLPDLSSLALRNDLAQFGRRFLQVTRLTVLLIVPAAMGLIVLAHPVVSAFLQHGQFTAGGADLTGDILVAFSIGLPAFCLYLLAMRGFYACQDTRTPFVINLAETVLQVGLAVTLLPSMGAPGLALGFAVAYVAGAVLALAALHRKVGGLPWRPNLGPILRMVAAAGVMAVAVLGVTRLVGGDHGAGAIVRSAAGVAVGGAVYLGLCIALRIPDVHDLRIRRARG